MIMPDYPEAKGPLPPPVVPGSPGRGVHHHIAPLPRTRATAWGTRCDTCREWELVFECRPVTLNKCSACQARATFAHASVQFPFILTDTWAAPIMYGQQWLCRQSPHAFAPGASNAPCSSHPTGRDRTCQHPGCERVAAAPGNLCQAHGGSRRCQSEGRDKAARAPGHLCIKHGGGRRCQREGCDKGAQGLSHFCIKHGGGRRCQHNGCDKGAQGPSHFCIKHGGGRRCQ